MNNEFEVEVKKRYSFSQTDFELAFNIYYLMEEDNELENYFKNFNDFIEDFIDLIFTSHDIDVCFDDLDESNINKFKKIIIKDYINMLPNTIIKLIKAEKEI